MKLPNGYGSVHKVSGNRRKPYRARKTVGFVDGKQVYKNIGYYETKEDAIQALCEFNKNPYEINNKITFGEIYEIWSSKKYPTLSDSSVKSYTSVYKACKDIKDKSIQDINLNVLQGIIDAYTSDHTSRVRLKTIFKNVFDYAVVNNIIPKGSHKVEYLEIGKQQKSDRHYRFTDHEIDKLWHASDNEYIMVILMLIYTGVRPGELFALKRSDVTSDSFYIRQGKNTNAVRRVPIHERIKPFFTYWSNKESEYLITQANGDRFKFEVSASNYVKRYWKPLLSGLGILEYTNADTGKQNTHSPDDTRHTFTSMWHEKQLSEPIRRKIQGHSGKGIGEQVYNHMTFEVMRDELNKL